MIQPSPIITSNDLVLELGRVIVGDPAYADPWDALSLVIQLDQRKRMFGFVYLGNGDWEAQTPDSFDALKLADRLRETMRHQHGSQWKACLVQIHRADLRVLIDFEFDDADRWQVTPANLEARVEELRPVQ